jgi:hypothetical protein
VLGYLAKENDGVAESGIDDDKVGGAKVSGTATAPSKEICNQSVTFQRRENGIIFKFTIAKNSLTD